MDGKGKKRKCDGAPPHGAGPKKKKADVASGSDAVFGGESNPDVASYSDASFGDEGASALEGKISASNRSPDSMNPAILSGGSGEMGSTRQGRMLPANAAGCEDVSADEDPQALEALVVVPPCIGRAQRAVDFHEFSRVERRFSGRESEPADWQTSCCSLTLCSYCLPRELVTRHGWEGEPRCEGRGPRVLERHGPLWVCTRQLLVQVEQEQFDRSVCLPLPDIYLSEGPREPGPVQEAYRLV